MVSHPVRALELLKQRKGSGGIGSPEERGADDEI